MMSSLWISRCRRWMHGCHTLYPQAQGNRGRPCIIAMTAYALEGDRQECLDAGMNEYLRKPIQIGELKLALEMCSRGGKVRSSSFL